MSTLFAFLLHLCAFTLVAAVAIEFTLIRQELTLASARRLRVTDIVLGMAAGAIEAGRAPVIDAATCRRVTMIIHIELAAIAVIPLCAAIMARGGWV